MQYSNPGIEELLEKFRPVIGKDYKRYRNHVYRVFFHCLLFDSDKANEEKYAVAAVFHDIGIWTNHTFDYLDPSIAQVKIYLDETGKQDWFNEISLMIYWHHKISGYKGEYAATTGNFRKADWIDVSLGLLKFGIKRKRIREIRKQFPNKGFHWLLVRLTIKNFFKHPFNPIPVFKK